jgi:hypothetical protein
VRSVLWWTVAGVAVPLVLNYVPLVVISAVAGGLEDLSYMLGWAPLAVIIFAPPGALCGLVVGIVDYQLKRFVGHGSPATRRRRSIVAAVVLFALLAAVTIGFLAYMRMGMGTNMVDLTFNVGSIAVIAAVPAAIAYIRYARIAPIGAAA